MSQSFDPLSLLSRRGDKWFLGNGSGLIYAPSFPEYLDVLGFYDYADFYDIKVEPVFTMTILDENFRPIQLECDLSSREWTPSYFKQKYVSTQGIEVTEWRTASASYALTSTLEIAQMKGVKARESQLLHMVPWVAYPAASVIDARPVDTKSMMVFRKNPSIIHVMGSKHCFSYFTVNLSQGSENKPLWSLTPFADKIYGGQFKNEIKRQVGTDPYGLLYIGLHYPLRLSTKGTAVFSFSSSFSLSGDEAVKRLEEEIARKQPDASSESWRSFFSEVPEFHCSNPFIEKYYWYRWYGLHLMTIGKLGNHKYPCVYEGLRVFRKHISYSAQTHVLETRWMKNPTLAQGCMLGLFHYQKSNGFLPGIVGTADVRDNTFYHANWGKVAAELYKVHPDLEFLRQVYEPLMRYLNYFNDERDCDHDYLYDILDEMESGQELNPRYLHADAEADKDQPLQEPLEGVDATAYIYELQNALGFIAEKVGKKEDAKKLLVGAAKCRSAIRDIMWDHSDRMFYDVRPSDHEKSKVKAITCFYPFMSDVATQEHLPSIKEHLLNDKEFWTPTPVATLSMESEHFSADAEWKGKRMMCPWNGRVWPMTNSHIAEALVYTAESNDDEPLRSVAANFISEYIKMMFFDEDFNRPNCYEHYNPLTGDPCTYRGVDDYQHSWVVDLIIKYVCGIRPTDPAERSLLIDPLPFNLEDFSIQGVPYQGHNVAVSWNASAADATNQGLNVYLDGKRVASSKHLEKLRIDL
jgi:hypothetical protein